jgi:hypothetical protein
LIPFHVLYINYGVSVWNIWRFVRASLAWLSDHHLHHLLLLSQHHHQVVHYTKDLIFKLLMNIVHFVALGDSEPPVSSQLHSATIPSTTPSPPTPSVAASATLEEDSFQDAVQSTFVNTPGPLFDPGANSTMVRSR